MVRQLICQMLEVTLETFLFLISLGYGKAKLLITIISIRNYINTSIQELTNARLQVCFQERRKLPAWAYWLIKCAAADYKLRGIRICSVNRSKSMHNAYQTDKKIWYELI